MPSPQLRIYLAGPMRNIPEFNHPAFLAAAQALRAAGHEVFSPAEHNLNLELDPTGLADDQAGVERKFPLRACLGDDLAWICESAEAVVLLPGWEASKGACAEMATALALGLPVWELASFLNSGPDAPLITAVPCQRCAA